MKSPLADAKGLGVCSPASGLFVFTVDLIQRGRLHHLEVLENLVAVFFRSLCALPDLIQRGIVKPGRPAEAHSPLRSHRVEHAKRLLVLRPQVYGLMAVVLYAQAKGVELLLIEFLVAGDRYRPQFPKRPSWIAAS